MNVISEENWETVIDLHKRGFSIRGISRITGNHRDTVSSYIRCIHRPKITPSLKRGDGFCECGCGRFTKKDQIGYRRFINGHKNLPENDKLPAFHKGESLILRLREVLRIDFLNGRDVSHLFPTKSGFEKFKKHTLQFSEFLLKKKLSRSERESVPQVMYLPKGYGFILRERYVVRRSLRIGRERVATSKLFFWGDHEAFSSKREALSAAIKYWCFLYKMSRAQFAEYAREVSKNKKFKHDLLLEWDCYEGREVSASEMCESGMNHAYWKEKK
jgi:hypothetical protein